MNLSTFLIGFVLGLAGGASAVWWLLRNREQKELGRLRAANQAFRADRDRLERRVRAAEGELAVVRDQAVRVAKTALKFRAGGLELQRRLKHALGERDASAQADAARGQEAERLHDVVGQLNRQLDEARTQLADLGAEHGTARKELEELQALSDRLDDIVEGTGNVWLRDVPPATPGGTPSPRRMPVVAVLNFKGGVGKTTLTANLAPILAGRGERVLAIDLDYQGSLTSLALPPTELRVAAAERRLAQDLLTAPPTPDVLQRFAAPCGDAAEPFHVLAATDHLADHESRLMTRWIARPEEGDVRFVLRAAVDAALERGDFDRVLIDCPPRLSTACVNALACCNYVLVPVLLDRTSSLAAPRLLGLLRKFRPLLDRLNGVGIVANRATRTPLTGDELDVWDEVLTQCRDEWGGPVDRFETVVPQRIAFRDAANRHRLSVHHDRDVRDVFSRLAAELAERVPCESRGPAPVPR